MSTFIPSREIEHSGFGGTLFAWDKATDTRANVSIRIGDDGIVIDALDGRQWTVVASEPAAMRFIDSLIQTLNEVGASPL